MLIGGAGSLEFTGMGNGTSNIVYNRSGGENSSIGKILERADAREVRTEIVFAPSAVSRILEFVPMSVHSC